MPIAWLPDRVREMANELFADWARIRRYGDKRLA
jgi:hypothetical protein